MGARIVEQLDLDAKQKQAWEKIQAELAPKRQAAFASAGSDPRGRREAMRKVSEEGFARLEPLLRPDQKTRLAALRAGMTQGRGSAAGMRGGTVYVLREGKPTPLPVRVGATDGTSTEVVGPLKPGDQVVVGGGPKPKPRAGAPMGAPGGGAGGVRVRM